MHSLHSDAVHTPLLVETGRHTGTPYQQRIFSFCHLHEIEDDYQFLLVCPLYADKRFLYLLDNIKYCRPSVKMFYEIMK